MNRNKMKNILFKNIFFWKIWDLNIYRKNIIDFVIFFKISLFKKLRIYLGMRKYII